ncbi:MAG: glycosyltransferase [candidate division KSB1 bacterium]|nr:glycosyltransferase [candidate division KSB1 bacterium]MDZ7273701.1 glycosyltransferase [candidate division KSB1 bacterium]MDZ7285857.1 glycosyltransferase [candidate division KSB1 bacterium]MDZ7298889.1 glycosyltransferase [candidate division KSB1 bacterium]MDZ7309080.1 glycosyltransferase [candidate division KSB1 bacterium]
MNAADLRVLIVSEFYPHPAQPHAGLFVREQLLHLHGCQTAAVITPAIGYPPLPRYRHLRQAQPAGGVHDEAGRVLLRLRVHHVPVLGERCAPLEFLWRATAAVKRWRLQFDLIHAHWAYRSGWVASRLAQQFGRPLVLTAQGSDINLWRHERRKRAKLLAALHAADAILALNDRMRADILAEGVAPAKVVVMPQGVDCHAFQPAGAAARPLRPRQFVPAFVLLCVANHHPVKGVDVLLRALAQTSRALALVLVGAGPETRVLQNLAHALNLEARVWFAGAQPPETIPQWIHSADAVVIPSRSEGGPAILLQALACGKPVVATATGMAPALLTDERIGLLVPVEDEKALAQALERVCRQQWDAKFLRQQVLPFCWEEIGRRLVAVYRHVLRRE